MALHLVVLVGAFLFFSFLYSLPFLLDDFSGFLIDGAVGRLSKELLYHGTVRLEIFRILLVLLLQLAAVCSLSCWLGLRVSRRIGCRPYVVCIALLILVWLGLVSLNSWLFPHSNYSVSLSALSGPGPVFAFLAFLLLAIFLALPARRAGVSVLVSAIILGGGASFWSSIQRGGSVASGRNIILIGVDSLSADAFERNQDILPNLAVLKRAGGYYSRAYSQLGRTFPAWLSILSGRVAAEHGGVFNLLNVERVERQDLLAVTLQDLRYHTVFAIDERRFANIDESFGFDRVVGPKVGALDFILQGITDNPLSNLLLQTPFGSYLFPYSYINVAAHGSYSAKGFVGRVFDLIQTEKPLFLAVHFESGHFPYKTRHAKAKVAHDNPFMSRYLEAMTVVDWQVGQLLAGLKAQGRLDDALVVILSDHGEALGEIEAELLRDGQPFELRGYGHGGSLLSDQQNRVVLGMVRFRHGEPVSAPATHSQQVSLLDIREVVENFARTGSLERLQGDRCLIVETGLRLAAASDYRSIKEGEIVAQAAGLYELDELGRLMLREEVLPRLLASKDIGWRCVNRVTWYDASEQRYFAYSLDSRGVPEFQVEPDEHAVAHISAYRDKYLRD